MRRLLASLATALLLTSGCVVASPDADTYEDAAASTLGTTISEVATVQKLIELLHDGDIPRPAVVAQLRHSEEGVSRVAAGFGSLNPPREQDLLSEQAAQLLDEAESMLQRARVAVHRSSTGEYQQIAQDLGTLATQLEELEASAS